MAQARSKMEEYRHAMRSVSREDNRNAWYLQLVLTIVLAGVLYGVAALLGHGNAEWPVPAALIIGAFVALIAARIFAFRRLRTGEPGEAKPNLTGVTKT